MKVTIQIPETVRKRLTGTEESDTTDTPTGTETPEIPETPAATETSVATPKDSTTKTATSATKLSLSQTTLTLYTVAKKTGKLQVVGATGAVTWASADTKVATVDKNGVVKAKKKGSTIITATTAGQTLSCKVTVKKPTIKVKKKALTVKRGKKVKLKYTLTPKGAKPTFTSKNKKIATVNKAGMISGKKKGKTKITLQYGGTKVKVTVTVK